MERVIIAIKAKMHKRRTWLDPRVPGIVLGLVSGALGYEAPIRGACCSERHVRRMFSNGRIPPPNDWSGFGRCLVTLRHLRQVQDPVFTAALKTGWSEPSNFFRRCKVLFSSSPRSLCSMSDEALLEKFMETRSPNSL